MKSILATFLIGLLSSHAVSAATNIVPALITTDMTLSGTNLVQGTVFITNDAVLTIEPGTQMLMNTNARLVVYGQLLADGTTNQPIAFTRATTAARWRQISFVRAADSRLRNCVIEYANCAGDHQNYYTNDIPCNTNSLPRARNYTEAILSLATHVDIEGCTFRNLVSGTGAGEGDAIALISDDRVYSGRASGRVLNSRFLNIGQGVHTRYAYVLIEGCTFSGKGGDNDGVDLYGESVPRPLIRRNLFLPGHEDAINPTRCSAIIIENTFIGGDDHGIVLRDKCQPIVMNNVIRNFTNACIAVQNQCDALIANNTIINSARGIRFFDHFSRHGEPYCLIPGSGRATIINNIIWNCPISLELTDSPDGHSWASVSYCNIANGQASASVSANATLIWGPGNINVNPQFVSLTNLHLLAGSPCIDAGTNALSLTSSNWSGSVTNDLDGVPRPLDGNGDGMARFDIGAYEFLLASADSNGDGIPDGWTWQYGLNPADPNVGTGNPDGDAHSTEDEWIADTDPTDAQSILRISRIARPSPPTHSGFDVSFLSSSNRVYTLHSTDNLDPAAWTAVPGQIDVRGNGGTTTLGDPALQPKRFYRIDVELP